MNKKIVLFCIPFAGGSSTCYMKWQNYLNDSIEMRPIELAGRGSRFNEEYLYKCDEMVEDIYANIEKEIVDTDYAFFGHSMGGMLAYRVCCAIVRNNKCLPKNLIISSKLPFHIERTKKQIGIEFQEEFINEVIKMGGTSKEIISNSIFTKFFYKTILADFQMMITDLNNSKDTQLDIDLTVLNGKQDHLMNHSEMQQWKQYTTQKFNLLEFEGGHFYFKDKLSEVVNSVNKILIKY